MEEKNDRIQDLRKQVDSINTQLETKDDQISQLNEITQKQASTHSELDLGEQQVEH
ncbi:hypothetical protein [Methanosarcina barkeri]|uniref:hypothetical protein n=1 Tax=Methanosarcina barkeri TaxID=2208 RepID=UPI000AA31B14|nr:hypothetical protein [Methanosarcina barkeri]